MALMQWVAEALSLAPVGVFVALLVVGTLRLERAYFAIAAGMVAVAVATELIKRATIPYLAQYPFLARPRPRAGERHCGILGRWDHHLRRFGIPPPVGADAVAAPGMPSGHSAMISFAITALILYRADTIPHAAVLGLVALSLGTTWSRVALACHTIPQVIAGIGLGTGSALLIHALFSPYL